MLSIYKFACNNRYISMKVIPDMPKCIYCKKNKEINHFSNGEHVIPKAFGTFSPNNLVLNSADKRKKSVCNECNNNFSKFERWLAKDTFEGYVLRSKYENTINSPDRRRVKIVVAEGNYKGLYVELTENGAIQLLPQVGLQKHNDEWDYFLPTKIEQIDKRKYSLAEDSLRAFCLSDDEARAVFNRINIKFVMKGNLPAPLKPGKEILCEIESKVDKIIRRSIAKIAFNFFSYFNYKNIILNDAFDEVREFVLNGENKIPIQISNESVFADERNSNNRKLGHIIVLNKNRDGYLIAQVSLFNYLKYTVLLTKRFTDKNLMSDIGYYFDVGSKTIIEIQKSSLIIPQLIVPANKFWLPKK